VSGAQLRLSAGWERWLSVRARLGLRRYSVRNQLLICLQRMASHRRKLWSALAGPRLAFRMLSVRSARPVMLAEIDSESVAGRSIGDGHAVANPFRTPRRSSSSARALRGGPTDRGYLGC
jgi:hypothetical protein